MALFDRKRQSAPRPTAEDYLAAQDEALMRSEGIDTAGGVRGVNAAALPVGRAQVQAAMQTLIDYKAGKAHLEQRVIDNEQWYKLRHWECMRDREHSEVEPTSAWLFNVICSKHADAMDNYPSVNLLPREEGDKAEAKMLSSIIPVILDENDFEGAYSDVWYSKLKTGTGVYGVFFDKSKAGGLGDIAIKEVSLLSLFWEPGIKDIQLSRNVFNVELCDNDILISQYPQLNGKLGSSTLDLSKYVYDDTVDTSKKSAVVDWYYRKTNGEGKTVLHYCKYVNDNVLFATENDPSFSERGWYDHAKYPFVFDRLFPSEGTPTGFGYLDVEKDTQSYIDRGNQAILQNMLSNARPRFFIRSDGAVNETEFANMNNDFVHTDGSLGQDSILPINGKSLSDIYVNVINNKVEELKETSGNRDVSNGGSTSGVTSGAAIAALQESGSKLSRNDIKGSYRAFKEVCVMVIELIRQFYDLPRCFRITGENGAMEFVQYSNAGIQPQPQGNDFGVDMGYRIPYFDIEVTAQKASPYTKLAQNELALQFYGAGFFNPQMADQALACLDMMDFDRKQFVIEKIQQNGGMYQQMMAMQGQMMALAQIVDATRGSNITEQLAAQFGGGAPVAPVDGGVPQEVETAGDEAPTVKKAKERVADSTAPR